MITIAIFWILVFTIFYCYLGYTLVLWIAASTKKILVENKQQPGFNELPEVTLLIAAYNEANYVKQKVENTLKLNYPTSKIHQVWITDGSTDQTNQLLSEYPFINVLYQPQRGGKTAALNRAIPYINTPLVIFCDANTILSQNSIIDMVAQFANPKVGCVAGEKQVLNKNAKGASSTGEGFYWKYESLIKRLESETGSVLGAAGELFAIRTSLYKQIPTDTILDDFTISLNIAKIGYKVVYCKSALAKEYGSASFTEEMKRKVRIAAGGFQLIARNKYLLNPLKHSTIVFKFLSHKFLRWAIVPFCFYLLPAVNVIIILNHQGRFYTFTLFLLLAFYIVAIIGYLLQNKNIKPHSLYLPFYVLLTNHAQIKGLLRYLSNKQDVRWEKARRENEN